MILASVYGGSDDGEPNRLRHWLQLKQWSLSEAAALIADLDPESLEFSQDRIALLSVRTLRMPDVLRDDDDYEGDECPDGSESASARSTRLQRLHREIRDLERLLGGLSPRQEVATPAEWIASAVDQKIHVPWLAWAEWQKLAPSTPRPLAANDMPLTEKERQSLLKIVAALCALDNLDMKTHTKAAGIIVRQCEQMGINLSVNTAAKFIKQATELKSDI